MKVGGGACGAFEDFVANLEALGFRVLGFSLFTLGIHEKDFPSLFGYVRGGVYRWYLSVFEVGGAACRAFQDCVANL